MSPSVISVHEKVSLHKCGWKWTLEQRQKFSEKRKGIKFSDAHKKSMSLSRKGRTPWNKGLKNSQIAWNKGKRNIFSHRVLEKMKLSMRGRTPWNKGKPFLAIRGEKNPRWKGGITEINNGIRHSLEYKLWRRAVFARDNFTCQLCPKRGGNLEADHIKPFTLFPELRFAIDNGRTLCVPCHRKTPTYKLKVLKLVRADFV